MNASHGIFSFPNPVNERAARVVAGVVMVLGVLTLATSAYWVTVVLAYGFWARVLTGPTLSPLAWLASSVIAPRLGPERPVAGPPKRFAQGMGAAMTTGAALCGLVLGLPAAADGLLIALVVAAGLEAIFALCLGCRIFALLMRTGLVPENVCVECANWGTQGSAASAP